MNQKTKNVSDKGGRDVYRSIDSINESIPKISKIVDEAKIDDPEFYDELKTIFKSD